MKSICGADCSNCGFGKNNNCKGCVETGGCPFGNQCFIAKYISISGTDNFNSFKEELINEFNSLNIPGMPTINELFPMNGAFVNLAYPMPNGEFVKILEDNGIYLCNQVECLFNDGELIRCFGLVAGMDFLLVSEFGANGASPELVVYKKR